ncbi:MAG: hypothetical protein H6667_12990 [Ardenticatenaceae bacterium]|nr:hypothetical protein [Ardenticatenaceae bacterium]MCB9442659.1 hypothetical protein [Ardenticatenaceae bacterium]
MKQARQLFALGVVLLSLLISCRQDTADPEVTIEPVSTPTLHPLFSHGPTAEPQPTSTPRPTREEPVSAPPRVDAYENAKELPVFSDELAPNWSLDISWDLDYEIVSDVAHSGTNSIKVTPKKEEAGLYFTVKEDANRAYSRDEVLGISFWLYSGEDIIETDDLAVTVTGSNQYPYWASGDDSVPSPDDLPPFSETRLYYLNINRDIPAETWVLVELWLDDREFDPVYEYVTGLYIKNDADLIRPFYVDDVNIITLDPLSGVETATESPLLIAVDAERDVRPISPLIYGMNFASPDLVQELQIPVNRWGGNATTRYNWQIDATNRGADWYFMNTPNENENPDALPAGSASDGFIAANQGIDAETILTIPIIGWTAKNREINCGFSVEKYGEQAEVAPDNEDCGNGIRPDGTLITDTVATDTSLAVGENFTQQWLDYLQREFGQADDGGVKFYSLDNEPTLWNVTHRDIHPEPVGYDELLNRTEQYAALIKETDPTAQVLGPVLWGWTAYFYSGIDVASGENYWRNPPDQSEHEDLPLVAWYLQELNAYEETNGTRLLDYFDLHYYPQADGIALQPVGDAANQALRLRSTRSLWDPTYVDESWIDEPVQLIPRMREWVDTYYPETKIAISEYNWGAADDINGALTQADVLGIFGREGVDLATLWESPDVDSPLAYAFRMFRNYDGQNGKFGDTAVWSTSENQDLVSVYSALDSETGSLYIMLINKDPDLPVATRFQIENFPRPQSVTLYRYDADNLDEIVSETIDLNTESVLLPPYSINLYVLSLED